MTNKESNNWEMPSAGMMVKEEYELAQFADCCLYVLPSTPQLDGEEVKKHLEEVTRWNEFLNQYDLEVLDELPYMDNHPKLDSAFKDKDYNLIMGMKEPGAATGKQYLLAKSDKSSLRSDISKIIHASELVTRQSVQELMIHHALCSPGYFFQSTEHIWESQVFWKNYVKRRLADAFGGISYNIAPSTSSLLKKLGLGEILTHRKKMEMQERFAKDLIAIRNSTSDERAWTEVKIILESLNINNTEVIHYLRSVSDRDIEHFVNKVTPRMIAEQSTMTMEVKYVGKVDKKRTSDGRFRVYFYKDGIEQLVHFKRHSACILYIIYLIDIKKTVEVDTLDIMQYENDFCKLFNEIYGYDGGKEYFNTMLSKANGHSEQKILKNCLSDIRMAVGNACERLNESAKPYVLDDALSHLCVLDRNVKIDDRLIAALQAK